MNILVLAGGLSPERDVSLSSGCMIANALTKAGHSVHLLDVYEGTGFTGAEPDFFSRNRSYEFAVPETEPDLEAVRIRNGGQKALIGKNVLECCHKADVVFLALHGAMGENGQLQATLDSFGIRYTGTGYDGCLLAMDKALSKTLMNYAGIPTAGWTVIHTGEKDVKKAVDAIGLPCVVKPCGGGSSIGVSIVHSYEQLSEALQYAEKYESALLIEKWVQGREFSVGILDGQALPVIEICPLSGFYDYKNKYQEGLTKEICPAELSTEQTQEVQKLALEIHRLLRLGSYSRIDFILNPEGAFICLEANTLPGMTPTSLLPQEAACAGMPYEQLCCRIAELAIK